MRDATALKLEDNAHHARIGLEGSRYRTPMLSRDILYHHQANTVEFTLRLARAKRRLLGARGTVGHFQHKTAPINTCIE